MLLQKEITVANWRQKICCRARGNDEGREPAVEVVVLSRPGDKPRTAVDRTGVCGEVNDYECEQGDDLT